MLNSHEIYQVLNEVGYRARKLSNNSGTEGEV